MVASVIPVWTGRVRPLRPRPSSPVTGPWGSNPVLTGAAAGGGGGGRSLPAFRGPGGSPLPPRPVPPFIPLHPPLSVVDGMDGYVLKVSEIPGPPSPSESRSAGDTTIPARVAGALEPGVGLTETVPTGEGPTLPGVAEVPIVPAMPGHGVAFRARPEPSVIRCCRSAEPSGTGVGTPASATSTISRVEAGVDGSRVCTPSPVHFGEGDTTGAGDETVTVRAIGGSWDPWIAGGVIEATVIAGRCSPPDVPFPVLPGEVPPALPAPARF